MTTVAVVAHEGKTFGGGLGELRAVLADEGFDTPIWYQVDKSRKAPSRARKAVEAGADLVFVWGGDGTVQRCIDALAGSGASVAILPAGTANLLAGNLGVPTDLREAVLVGLHGDRRALDTGRVNGEHFAVMAGAGLDALMIKDADRGMKDRVGRLAYIWTGARNLPDATGTRATISVDGQRFFKGKAACVLIGNVGQLFGGVTVFEGSRPDDGVLELGVVTARTATEWARTLSRLAFGNAERSPFVSTTRGKSFDITFDKPLLYELDGGARPPSKRLRVRVRPGSVSVCVPVPGS